MKTELIQHDIDGAIVSQRASDGYLNATAMCAAAGKRWNNYWQNDTSKDFAAELATDTGIPVSALIQSAKGGLPEEQGTWVHPYVAIHLAQWLSPRFAVQVSKWVYNFTTDLRHAAGELNRLIDGYLAEGRSEDWIRERIDGLLTRRELTDQWRTGGGLGRSHYGILTRMLHIRSIGLGPKEHRELKGLAPRASLRDNCDEMELLFIRLGERSTTEIARANDAKGYGPHKDAVIEAGNIVKNARLQLEQLIGRSIASPDKFQPPSLPAPDPAT
jgi:hypothetical protein